MIKKKLTTIVIILMAMLTTVSYSEDLSGISGAFADIGLGLRPLGFGGAYSALASDENAARWNPAMLGSLKNSHAGFTWTNQFSLVTYNYIAAAMPIMSDLGVGAYVIAAGDEVYSETTIGLSAGISGSRFNVPVDLGATLKILSTSFGNDASGGEDRVTGDSFGMGLDLGLLYKASESIALALTFKDLINNITWNSSARGEYSEGVPMSAALAAGFNFEKASVGVEYAPSMHDDVADRFSGGLEVTLWKVLKPRVGVAQNISGGDVNRWSSIGMGVDIRGDYMGPIDEVKFGYTHIIHDIESSPRVGLTLVW